MRSKREGGNSEWNSRLLRIAGDSVHTDSVNTDSVLVCTDRTQGR